MSATSQSFLARRSNSTASLAQFYHDAGAVPLAGSGSGGQAGGSELDFCNAFWGRGDAGYEVLMARVRASGKTVDELRGYWKERASIEEEYAKRLTKLAKATLGKDEVGDLRACLDNLKAETDKQAGARMQLALEIRRDVESPMVEFAGRMTNLKKTYAANIEKSCKNKVAQEAYVSKARERYEQDCLRINAFTANSSIVQGKELDKLQRQMEKVQATVGGNEREFRSAVRQLEETTNKWESEWKGFCDHVQDLEEERMEAIKDNIWVYANAVSSVCVTDDESCERIRVTLEGFETANDIEGFVKNFGTGALIPDPPPYVDYSRGEAYNDDKPTRTAHFVRQTTRVGVTAGGAGETQRPSPAQQHQITSPVQDRPPTRPSPAIDMAPQPVPPPPGQVNGHDSSSRDRAPSVPPMQPPAGAFGGVALPGMAAQGRPAPSASPAPPAAPSTAQSASTALYNPPTARPPSAFNRPTSAIGTRSPAPTGPEALRHMNGEEDDPVARSLAELRRDPPPAGSIRRGTSTNRRPESTHSASRSSMQGMPPRSPAPATSPTPDYQQHQARSSQSMGPPQHTAPQQRDPTTDRMSYQAHQPGRSSVSNLVPPAGGMTAVERSRNQQQQEQQRSSVHAHSPSLGGSQDLHSAAAAVVGSAPEAPRTPSPAFMQPPTQSPSHLDAVLGQYHQAFPGERSSRGPSRQGSISSRHSRAHSVGNVQAVAAPRSPSPAAREGFVGIGSGNPAARANSPQPGARPSSTMPDAAAQIQRSHTPGGGSYSQHGHTGSQSGHLQYGQQQQQRPPSTQPSQVPGMQPGQAPTNRYSTYSGSPAPQTAPLSVNSRNSMGQYGSMPSVAGQAVRSPAQYSGPSAAAAPPAQGYQTYQPPPQQVASPVSYDQYGRPVAAQSFAGGYNGMTSPPPMMHSQTPAQQYAAAVSPAIQQAPANGMYRPVSTGPATYQPPQQAANPYHRAVSPAPAHSPASQYGQQQQPHNAYQRAASPNPQAQQHQQYQAAPVNRSPSPVPPQAPVDAPPTGQYSTTGQPILFYVKALYDYEAQSDAEFDFQVGDIIAVTQTPEDGWWSGELLDEARRRPGRTDFPSNFVCLF